MKIITHIQNYENNTTLCGLRPKYLSQWPMQQFIFCPIYSYSSPA